MNPASDLTPVSAVIITKNEENHIARCLGSLTWADEILVIDGQSSDRTVSICKEPKAPWADRIRVIEREWSGFREQRNFALQNAKNDWVLVMDSDEKCSDALKARLKVLTSRGGPAHPAYKVRRQEYFLEKPIRYGIWNPSYQDRFFNRKGVEYKNEVHEYPVFPVKPLIIHEPIEHAPDFSPEKFLDKMNRYTTIEARDRFASGMRTNWFRILFAFPAMFLKNYFYYRAWRDGYHGFVISLLEGTSRVVRHIKIWRLQKKH